MKTKYFGYYFKDHDTGKKHFYDLRNFLKNFSLIENPTYKNSFKHQEESLYLFPTNPDVFLFIETRNTDFFRRIKKSDLTLEDLRTIIDQDSTLGYGSYLVVDKNHFGMASTYMAPGLTPLISFINAILGSIGLHNIEFRVKPILKKNVAKDVLKLNVIGRTSIEIPRSNTLAQQVANVFAQDISNDLSLGSIEIVFKPVQKGNIKPIVAGVLENIKDDAPDFSVKMRAKEFIKDTLTDFYLDENNAVSDEFNYKTESEIPSLMLNKMTDNKFLKPCLEEFTKNVKAEAVPHIHLASFDTYSAWAHRLGSLSQLNK